MKHLFDENDVTIIIKLHTATSRIQKFDTDCDVTSMFKV